MRGIIQIISCVLVIVGISGCLPFEQELQLMLNQHKITKKMYLKNDIAGYDGYEKNKKSLYSLKRGEEYEIINIKEGYARLAKSKNNKLQSDVWVDIDALEIKPTYFLILTTNVSNPKIIVEGQKYESNMRLPKGDYRVDIYADSFLDKSLEIKIYDDTKEKINLDFDIEAEKERIAKQKAEKKRLAKEKAKREKIAKKIKKSIYIDKQQKVMWQDDTAVIKVQKPWITKANYDIKNYNDTSGDTATTYCKNLTLVNFSDWRLPTKDELKNLYNQKSSLKNVGSNWYWSSTCSENIIDRAWGIYFNNGDGYSDLKNTINYVRCVRGGRQ